jgi:hypothetical protein
MRARNPILWRFWVATGHIFATRSVFRVLWSGETIESGSEDPNSRPFPPWMPGFRPAGRAGAGPRTGTAAHSPFGAGFEPGETHPSGPEDRTAAHSPLDAGFSPGETRRSGPEDRNSRPFPLRCRFRARRDPSERARGPEQPPIPPSVPVSSPARPLRAGRRTGTAAHSPLRCRFSFPARRAGQRVADWGSRSGGSSVSTGLDSCRTMYATDPTMIVAPTAMASVTGSSSKAQPRKIATTGFT